ncbi:hypothetical protein GCM10011571_15280 [Marinithermofilum abyssi]|uniref:Xylose isomerase-like TIM barrel domain-containing protein n=1 Tax=Marinithermofilum abyssi TaxID=1571185 RepID=A0A8J2YCD0_9BACL|nr:hypothetical protein [Marinithermofilum abyssi]GGE14736.1 hypothetical protein GCM10011571_15280 [Marinithermofilum abyssi]
MLFSNPLAVSTSAELHELHQVADQGMKHVEVQLPSSRYTQDELQDLFQATHTSPIAFRAPKTMGLGSSDFILEEWEYWLKTVAPLFSEDSLRYVVCHGTAVTLGEVFEYLDARPQDFNGLHDYKTRYVEKIIEQLEQLHSTALKYNIQLCIENAPMGGDHYFEPGKGLIYPALRTPRHLQRIAEATEVQICLDTANARITSNVLSYMHRSRSLFAGATEKEILNTTRDWIEFYQQVQKNTVLVRLSYAVSWGDTPQTTHTPFPEEAYPELLEFAEQVDDEIPILLATGKEQDLQDALKPLRQLKKR